MIMAETSTGFPDSPMEQDEATFPCKGCGEILEEGKAFELAGNRWHIDCFRCNTCLTLLDSDANLLLLGDGSLICNNCTYSCSACGNKIEDLAILTGDQAFCATCFRCRNCKKKIENLKYARTSQGIFCMECHESLMQRRRKKSAKNGAHRREKHNHNHHHHQGGTMLLDKSLPSLPPSAVDRNHTLSPDNESLASDGYSDTPTELPRISPHNKAPTSKSSSHSGTPTEPPRRSQRRPPLSRSNSSRSTKRDRSPAAAAPTREEDPKDTLILPATTYQGNRNSFIADPSGQGDEFCIPLAFDPNPAPGRSPLARQHHSYGETATKPPSQPPEGRKSRDYFNTNGPASTARVASQDYDTNRISSPSNSPRDSRHSSQPSSPHIAYQEIGREPSDLVETVRKRKDHGLTHGSIGSLAHDKPREPPPPPPPPPPPSELRPRPNGDSRPDKFKLQEVPKSKKSGSTRSSKSDGLSPSLDTSISSKSSSAPTSAITQVKEEPVMLPTGESPSSLRPNKFHESPLATHDPKPHELGSTESPTSQSSPASTTRSSLPQRKDSLGKPGAPKHLSRRDVSVGHTRKPSYPASNEPQPDKPSIPPSLTPGYNPSAVVPTANGSRFVTKPTDSPSSGSMTDLSHHPSLLRPHRDHVAVAGGASSELFVTNRVPPHPPSGHRSNSASISTQMSESTRNGDLHSPSLPRYSAGGEFSMDDDLARILGNEDHQASFLRRVSNSVRHARSYSDRGTRLSREQKWPKSPLTTTPDELLKHEFSSPLSSAESTEELTWFKNELRRERQKTVEREQRLQELEAALEAKSSIREMNSELQEKRVTMADLDTQKEVVLRELERLTKHIAVAKKSHEPLDLNGLINTVLSEFAEDLQKLKSSFSLELEELTQSRNELRDEVAELTQTRDQRAQEFGQLSARNAELAELNNHLVNQIQELYKANAGPTLDLVRPSPNGLGIYTHPPTERQRSLDGREPTPSITESNMTGSTVAHELDGDPPTYLTAPQVVNIRKAKVNKFNWKRGGQNVAKGVTKGLKAFTSNEPSKVHREGQFPDGQQSHSVPPTLEYPGGGLTRAQMQDPQRQGFGLFGNPKQKPTSKNASNNTVSVINADGSPALFGSDLEHRADYEKADIPGIVMRCIQEVELRGMDVEGIYRKSGGNSQIQQIKEGFERSSDYDISDPDLDINAVTSTLKQYFRKLPSPLITYEVYDRLLESATVIVEDPPRCIALMRTAIDELPPRHRACLEVLVFHLARVVKRERENLMTSLNVAVVFAPTIMRPESLVREMSDTQTKNHAVQFLIENCQGVFLPSGE